MDLSAITPALITASVAILVGVLNQLWTTRRELQKYDREVYQKLFAPILLNTYLWIDIHMDTEDKYSYDHHEIDDIKMQIINHIGNNIAYASSKLTMSYQKVNPKAKYFWYRDSDTPRRSEIELVQDFLNDFHKLIAKSRLDRLRGKISVLDRVGIKELEKFRVLYLTWYIASSVGSPTIGSAGGSVRGKMFMEELGYYNIFRPHNEKIYYKTIRALWNDMRRVGLKNRVRKLFRRKMPTVTFQSMVERIIKEMMRDNLNKNLPNDIINEILEKATEIDEPYTYR